MFAENRHEKIAEIIKREGAVSVSYLTAMFKVSAETIRRDLLSMEQKGLLSRVRGGAVKPGDMKTYMTLQQRNE